MPRTHGNGTRAHKADADKEQNILYTKNNIQTSEIEIHNSAAIHDSIIIDGWEPFIYSGSQTA